MPRRLLIFGNVSLPLPLPPSPVFRKPHLLPFSHFRSSNYQICKYIHSILKTFSIFDTFLSISVSLRYIIVKDEWITLSVGIYNTVIYHIFRCGFPNLPTPPHLFEFFVCWMFETFLNIDSPSQYLWNFRVSKWNDKLIE